LPFPTLSLSGATVVGITAFVVFVVAETGGDGSGPSQMEGGADERRQSIGSSSASNSRLLLPDLETTEPSVIYIEELPSQRKLRFSTAVSNNGEGVLELLGVPDTRSGRTDAVQMLSTEDGGKVARYAGEFHLDETHGHWHLRDFALFELWSYGPDARLRDRVANSTKITFCMMDQYVEDPPPAVVAEYPFYIECSWEMQGISEGWSEVYYAELPGQELDITDLADGRYALRVIIDPENQLHEANETNNAFTAYIEISDGEVTILPGP
jgi:hypothetical protein